MKISDDVKDCHRFVERTVPMMIHFQICEALNATVDQDMEKLIDFQRKKMQEIYRYVKSCEGKGSKINNMRKSIESNCKFFWSRDKGVSSFKFGDDFNLAMADHLVDCVDKKDELNEWENDMDTRNEAAKQKFI